MESPTAPKPFAFPAVPALYTGCDSPQSTQMSHEPVNMAVPPPACPIIPPSWRIPVSHQQQMIMLGSSLKPGLIHSLVGEQKIQENDMNAMRIVRSIPKLSHARENMYAPAIQQQSPRLLHARPSPRELKANISPVRMAHLQKPTCRVLSQSCSPMQVSIASAHHLATPQSVTSYGGSVTSVLEDATDPTSGGSESETMKSGLITKSASQASTYSLVVHSASVPASDGRAKEHKLDTEYQHLVVQELAFRGDETKREEVGLDKTTNAATLLTQMQDLEKQLEAQILKQRNAQIVVDCDARREQLSVAVLERQLASVLQELSDTKSEYFAKSAAGDNLREELLHSRFEIQEESAGRLHREVEACELARQELAAIRIEQASAHVNEVEVASELREKLSVANEKAFAHGFEEQAAVVRNEAVSIQSTESEVEVCLALREELANMRNVVDSRCKLAREELEVVRTERSSAYLAEVETCKRLREELVDANEKAHADGLLEPASARSIENEAEVCLALREELSILSNDSESRSRDHIVHLETRLQDEADACSVARVKLLDLGDEAVSANKFESEIQCLRKELSALRKEVDAHSEDEAMCSCRLQSEIIVCRLFQEELAMTRTEIASECIPGSEVIFREELCESASFSCLQSTIGAPRDDAATVNEMKGEVESLRMQLAVARDEVSVYCVDEVKCSRLLQGEMEACDITREELSVARGEADAARRLQSEVAPYQVLHGEHPVAILEAANGELSSDEIPKLFRAAKSDDVGSLQQSLQTMLLRQLDVADAVLNARDSLGHSLLHASILNGANAAVRFLLEEGMRWGPHHKFLLKNQITMLQNQFLFNGVGNDGYPVLSFFCRQTELFSEEFFATLLKSRADVSQRDSDHCTPFLHAAKSGNVVCMELLLKASSDVLFDTDADGRTALHWCAASSQDGAIKLLLQARADTSIQDMSGQIPADFVTCEDIYDLLSGDDIYVSACSPRNQDLHSLMHSDGESEEDWEVSAAGEKLMLETSMKGDGLVLRAGQIAYFSLVKNHGND